MSEALVFSIEEFSVFDGPGIRTTVFLSGCPLRCEWCHNPEGQLFENIIIRSEQGCLVCGNCERYSDENGKFTEMSIKKCPLGLLRYNSKKYTPTELAFKLSKNLDAVSGITFSGGEPLCNSEFLLDTLKLLKGKTSRALQTSGFADEKIFREVLSEVDYVLYDIKLVDSGLHKRYTGVTNEKIMKNFSILAKSGKPFVVRTPLIPTVTDTSENITAICELLRRVGVGYIELLPYNKFSGAKYRLVGRQYRPSFDGQITCDPHLKIFESHKIKVKLL